MRTLLLAGKNNLGCKAEGIANRIESAFVGANNEILTSRVVWDHVPVRISANEALQRTAARERASARAKPRISCASGWAGDGTAAKDLLDEAGAKAERLPRRSDGEIVSQCAAKCLKRLMRYGACFAAKLLI